MSCANSMLTNCEHGITENDDDTVELGMDFLAKQQLLTVHHTECNTMHKGPQTLISKTFQVTENWKKIPGVSRMRTVCNHHKAMKCHFRNGLTQNVTSPMLY